MTSPLDDFSAFLGPRRGMQRVDLTQLLSDEGRETLAAAARQATAWGGRDLDAAHLLWALADQEPTRTLLTRAGADPDGLRARLEDALRAGSPPTARSR